MSASISWQVCLKSAAQSKVVEGGQKRKGSTYSLSLAFSENRAWGKGKAFIMWVIIEHSRVRGLKHTDTSHDCLEPRSAELRCQWVSVPLERDSSCITPASVVSCPCVCIWVFLPPFSLSLHFSPHPFPFLPFITLQTECIHTALHPNCSISHLKTLAIVDEGNASDLI